MNIFVLDSNPTVASTMLHDTHIVKMILESAQLLSTTHRLLGSPHKDLVYKATHKNHPCALWVRETRGNYQWLFKHFVGLLKEYELRFGKVHACNRLLPYLSYNPVPIQEGLTSFVMAMPDEYKHDSPVVAYRRYYVGEKMVMKRGVASWRKDRVPEWLLSMGVVIDVLEDRKVYKGMRTL